MQNNNDISSLTQGVQDRNSRDAAKNHEVVVLNAICALCAIVAIAILAELELSFWTNVVYVTNFLAIVAFNIYNMFESQRI